MLRRSVIAGLSAATFVVGTALIPTATPALAGAAIGGAAGNWPQPGTWNWPEYASHPPECNWTQVKYYDHGRPRLHWVRHCQ